MRKTPTDNATGNLRIIGGQWRSRKLQFPAVDGLRPTGDRLRETLFNWLAPEIEGAHCLDLFAGSGALGLEALSRGAADCVFVEKDRRATEAIRQHLGTLKAEQGVVVQADVLAWLEKSDRRFDVVFLDPPFASDSYAPVLEALADRRLLVDGGKLYLEFDRRQTPAVPAAFQVLRDKTAGQTGYQLLAFTG